MLRGVPEYTAMISRTMEFSKLPDALWSLIGYESLKALLRLADRYRHRQRALSDVVIAVAVLLET